MRSIFQAPRELTDEAKQFIWIMEFHDGKLTEKDIAISLGITQRQVRKIVELYNFRKYINTDNNIKYTLIESKYHIIRKEHKERDYVLNKRLFNLIKEAKAYKMYVEDIGGDVSQLQLSIDDLIINYKEK